METRPWVRKVEYTGFRSLVKIRGAELNPFGNVINLYNWLPTWNFKYFCKSGLIETEYYASVKSSEAIKQFFVIIYSKLHSKSCKYLYKQGALIAWPLINGCLPELHLDFFMNHCQENNEKIIYSPATFHLW